MAPVRASLAPLSLVRTTIAGLQLPGHSMRSVASPFDFEEIDPAQRRAILRGLLGAMYAPPGGVGLAAPMAGLDLRMVVAGHDGRVLAMANPEIVATAGEQESMEEGNLCLPGLRACVVRPSELTVRWSDLQGRPQEETFDGWLARILFHEIELLDGAIFTDHVDASEIEARNAAVLAAEATAAIFEDAQPVAPPVVADPLGVLTLPPDLLTLRRSVLRIPADDVDFAQLRPNAARELVESMLLTQNLTHGVGLAAPQVGLRLRLAVIDNHEDPPLVLLNPSIVDRSDETEAAAEGCLSIPGHRGLVERAHTIRLRNHTVDGEPYERDVTGYLARIVQHEIDHLDGVLYPDLVTRPLVSTDPQTRVQDAFKTVYASSSSSR